MLKKGLDYIIGAVALFAFLLLILEVSSYFDQYGHLFQIPYMSGFGGNRVIFNPNGITTFVFSDAHIYLFESMVQVAEGIEPFPAP